MIYRDRLNTNFDLTGLKYLVVGCGFFGAVIAERIAKREQSKVVIIEKRDHIGGNCYSEIDGRTGIEYHKYGSHIFHTRYESVWRYINQYCSFNSYRHKVLTVYKNGIYVMPINLSTINAFYGLNLSPIEAEIFLRGEIEKEKLSNPSNLEEKAITLVGRRLYEALIRGYTVKQWGIDPRQLPADIIMRLPVRYNYKTDYFDDIWQGIPVEGYGKVFERMLDHKNIDVYLGVDFFDIRHLLPSDCLVVYTGPLDRYFDYRYGRLQWRTQRFEREVLPVGDFQGIAVMNYAEESVPFIRIHEFRHFHEERDYPNDTTLIMKEYPSGSFQTEDEPFYPVNDQKSNHIFKMYEKDRMRTGNIVTGGRLGSYKYINMDEAIYSALETYEKQVRDRGRSSR